MWLTDAIYAVCEFVEAVLILAVHVIATVALIGGAFCVVMWFISGSP